MKPPPRSALSLPADPLSRDLIGSFTELIAAALLTGRPFVPLDNMRGKVCSKYLEALIEDAAVAALREGMDGVVEGPTALPLHVDSQEAAGLRGPRGAGVKLGEGRRDVDQLDCPFRLGGALRAVPIAPQFRSSSFQYFVP